MGRETLTEVLMKDKRVNVLNTLLKNNDKEFSISDLSEESGVGYKTTHTLVGELEGFRVITVEEKGGSRIVSLNENSPYIGALENLGSIDSKPLREVAEKYAEELYEKYSKIESIILFGSVLHGLPTKDSDIDILILVEDEAGQEEIEEKVWTIRDRYEREEGVDISPIVMSKDKFKLNVENREPFENKIKQKGDVLEGEQI